MKISLCTLAALLLIPALSFADKDNRGTPGNNNSNSSPNSSSAPSTGAVVKKYSSGKANLNSSAISLYSDTMSTHNYDDNTDAQAACQIEVKKAIATALDGVYSGSLLHQKVEGDYQYACSAIVIIARTSSDTDGSIDFPMFTHFWSRSWFDVGVDITHSRLTALEVLCQPRTLIEKQYISAAKNCEMAPQPICFPSHPDYAKYMADVASVLPTQFIQDLKGSCVE